jgi:TolA-binding protein
LTFLNVPQLERQGADLQTKIEELQIIIQSLRENDKVKEEDALTHLSDQLLVLSERIYITVRKKTNNII